MIKKILIAAVIISLVFSAYADDAATAAGRPAVELDGAGIGAAAYIDSGSVYLPLRVIGEALGYDIKWSGEDRRILVSKPGKNMEIDLKNGIITANDHTYYMSGDYLGNSANGDINTQGVTYMAENFFSENLGLKVTRQNGKVRLESVKENAVSVKTLKEASETDHITITLQYPQIDGLDDKAVQDGINAAFEKAAMEARAEGLRNAEEKAKAMEEGYPGSPNKYETYFNYRVKYNQNGLLSVVLLNYQYTGGAHGLTVQSAYTFNLKTGEKYGLADLFRADSDYVSFISTAVGNEIDERVKEGMLYVLEPFESIKDGQAFYLSNDGIVIYFQQYEHFPYAAGIQVFPVAFAALKDRLKPEFSILHTDESPSDSNSGNAPFYGSKAAYAAEDGLYCVDMADGKAALLVKGTGIKAPVFSRDGNAVAYTREGDLYAYDFAAAQTRMLLEEAEDYCPGQNGGFYASSQEAGITAVDPRTAERSTIVPPESDTAYIHLKPSPDLKYLAYDAAVSGVENRDKGGTWLYDTASQKARMIVKAERADAASLGTRPSAGKWSPDSGKILIWRMSQSASLSADGVGAAIYDVAGEKLTELDAGGLAYNENISFAAPNAFAMITGGSRMMFEGKQISLFDLEGGQPVKMLETPGMVPTTPYYSPDGKRLVFAASPAAPTDTDYKDQIATISKRQLYAYEDGEITALTEDAAYRSEAPVFLNNNYIVFARIDAGGEKSIWLTDGDGRNERPLARWKYSDPNDDRAMDFYGRIDWRVMFDVFDGT